MSLKGRNFLKARKREDTAAFIKKAENYRFGKSDRAGTRNYHFSFVCGNGHPI